MYPQPYGQQQYYGPPPRKPFVVTPRLTAAVVGIVALAGVLCTLLPLWTLSVNPDDFRDYGISEPSGSSGSLITLHVGFYDWLTSSAPVFAMIPMALAIAFAVAVVQAVRGDTDRTLWGASAAFALCTLVLAVSVAIRPSSAVEVSGQLSRRLTPGDLSVNQGSSLDVGYGSGLIIAVICLVVVLGLTAWQSLAADRSSATPSPMVGQ